MPLLPVVEVDPHVVGTARPPAGMERQLTEAVDLVTGALMLASEDGMTMQRHVQRPARRLTPKVANIARCQRSPK